ncbi:MAG TPA: hypothetical protein VFN29_01205 [Chiayiivirga sp.]|nr:hypothetical protein [Chiayiivirga sp.]
MITAPEPFWNRLNAIALYPFRGGALISLIVLGLGSILTLLPSLIGLFFAVVIWFAVYRYCFEILVHTANGQLDAPEVTSHTESGVVWRFILLWLLLLITMIGLGIVLGPVASLVILLAAMVLMPGAVISLAIDGNLVHAINPSTALAIIRRIGAPYFAAVGLLFVFQATASNAGALLARFMPDALAHVLVMITSLWGLFATFHLMGYLVFQYHEALGFVPAQLGPKPKLRTRDSDLIDAVEARVDQDDIGGAIELLRTELRERAITPEAHILYRRLLRSKNDTAALLEHAGPYLNLLLLEKKDPPALALLRESLEMDPDFTPMQAEDGHRLAQRAREVGQAKLAVDLWLAMLKRWPRDPARVEWAIGAAQLLSQRDQIDLARAVLERCADKLDDPEPQARIQAAIGQLPAP